MTGYSSQSVLNIERLPYQTLSYGIGSDIGGGRTDELLEYVIGRFGPVASFSGSYRADSWILNIQQSLFRSGKYLSIQIKQLSCLTVYNIVLIFNYISYTIHEIYFGIDCQQPELSRPGSESISQVIGDIQLSNECSGELQMYESL